MMKKVLIGLTAGLVALGSFGVNAEAATQKDVDAAANKVVKNMKKSVSKKKNVSFTVKFKFSSKKKKLTQYKVSGKQITKALEKSVNAKLKNEVNKMYGGLPKGITPMTVKVDTKDKYALPGDKYWEDDGLSYTSWSYNKKNQALSIKLKCSHKAKRGGLITTELNKTSGAAYRIKNYQLFFRRISGITERKQLVWETVKYVAEHVNYDGRKGHYNISENAFYNKKFNGVCESLSNVTATYLGLAGIKDAGTVESDGYNHQWNYVKLDGKYYYFEVNSIDSGNGYSGAMVDVRYGHITEEEAMTKTFVDYKEYIVRCDRDSDDWVYHPCNGKGQFTVKGNNR